MRPDEIQISFLTVGVFFFFFSISGGLSGSYFELNGLSLFSTFLYYKNRPGGTAGFFFFCSKS